MNSKSWETIFEKYGIDKHDFEKSPFIISNEQIKEATKHFTKTNEKEVRILCKQDTREDRPDIFKNNSLFLLPIKNGQYVIIKGEGYIDIPCIESAPIAYKSKMDFQLETSMVGNSEMQHVDFAYASSIIRTFVGDESLVLTIRGRKYTPKFDFNVGSFSIEVESVQTEVDAGYEGRHKVVLLEAKNSATKNTIIRQLYYPFRQWQQYTKKDIKLLFFEKNHSIYNIWQFKFDDVKDYNSISLENSCRYKI